jgi:predicted nucleic acid-binding protein
MAAEGQLHVLDSSVFVAFYHAGDSCHQEAVETLKRLDNATLLVHPYVIQEVVTVLAYRIGKKVADDFLRDVLSSTNVRLVNPDLKAESEFFLRIKDRLSFTDSSLIVLAQQTKAELVTFDRQMETVFKKVGRQKG